LIGFRKQESDCYHNVILDNLDALYGFAMSLSRNPIDAEDLVQEACLRAIKGLVKRDIQSNPRVWLFTILRNVWINQWRRRTKGPEFIPLGKNRGEGERFEQWLLDERERPDANFERSDLSEKIRAAIAELPEVFREVVVLRYFEGLSYREIGSVLGCPAGTVMSRLSRARVQLHNMLDEKNTPCFLHRERRSG